MVSINQHVHYIVFNYYNEAIYTLLVCYLNAYVIIYTVYIQMDTTLKG